MGVIVDNDVIEVLNDLIENAKDGEYGFARCAERVKSPALKSTLGRCSANCHSAAAELQALVFQHGGDPAEHGSMLGALHRGWVSVKEALTPDSDHAVLAEAERGEDAAVARLRKALRSDNLPADVRVVVMRQMAGAQANHDEIKALRDSTRA